MSYPVLHALDPVATGCLALLWSASALFVAMLASSHSQPVLRARIRRIIFYQSLAAVPLAVKLALPPTLLQWERGLWPALLGLAVVVLLATAPHRARSWRVRRRLARRRSFVARRRYLALRRSRLARADGSETAAPPPAHTSVYPPRV
ncbi:hypothetical protein IDH44_17150 [Paenibacillus sp. IB182496]|uniref:Transmembrane protein n=1 Tax=Paenibacillus sabuli TaxID=2772509 RepID=A0A927BU93_9BACL|nr:hypothetical protein [Paenibacillus sabuli]MBD2846927.1 hypothetical protein [Paenibacillus sabuli]